MIKTLILSVSCFVLISCTDENSNPIPNSEEFSSTKMDEELPAYVEQELEQILLQERDNHLLRMTNKKFAFQCTDNCESGSASEATLMKYERYIPFNIERITTDSNCVVTFRFIDDCCLEFVGDIQQSSEMIALSYKNISNDACDCYCEYGYMFELKMENSIGKKITLNGSEL